jgi:hypothetical protein
MQTVGIIKDSVSLMIPVLTGFILLFGGALGKLWERPRLASAGTISWRLPTGALACAALSLFICFLVMSLCVNAATGENHGFFFLRDVAPKALADYARKCLFVAYAGFAVAVVFAGWFYYRIVRDLPTATPDRASPADRQQPTESKTEDVGGT